MEGGLDRLTELLAQALTQQAAPRETFKPPEYDGTSDVEGFIQQFSDVANANGWTDGAALLHLRGRLKEGATECGQGADLQTVFGALRSRYGMTAREARAKLTKLKKSPNTSLHCHATEVERLVRVAYSEVPDGQRSELAIETFCNTLANTQLQRHLLAVDTPDMQSAVRAGNEFLQIQPNSATAGVRGLSLEEKPGSTAVMEADPIQQLIKAVATLTNEVALLKEKSGRGARPRSDQSTKSGMCFLCHKEGHWKKNCPDKLKKKIQSAEVPVQGNGEGLQQ